MKNGFTLIELLAVIVILAIIALIATPIVLNIINDTKESAVFRSAEFYLDAVEQAVINKSMITGSAYKPKVCIVQQNGNLLCDDEVTLQINVKGDKPTSGEITFEDGKIDNIILGISGKEITTNSNGEFEYVLAPGLYDKDDKLLLSWEELEEEYGITDAIELGLDNVEMQNATYVIEQIEGANKLVIGESVEEIGWMAFFDCKNLASIIIPDSVTRIWEMAFWEAVGLISVIIPDSVTSIGYQAFLDCSNLKNITLSKNITRIEKDTFAGCNSLTSITIPKDVTFIDDGAFNSSGLTSITIPSKVANMGDSVFGGSELTNVIIEPGVTRIGNSAFSGCSKLKSVTIPESVSVIDDWAFMDCSSLVSVTIPNNVTRIGSMTFFGTGLTSIMIPRNVTYIGEDAFGGCENLTTINYSGTATGYPWGAPNNPLLVN